MSTLVQVAKAAAMMSRPIERKTIGMTSDGQHVDQITLINAKGAMARLITFGATLTELHIPDRSGNLADVVLGFDLLKQYEEQSPYFGATIGRVGNRIGRGRFSLDGRSYALVTNNGLNHLHGGFRGYDKRVWNAEMGMTADGPSVRFTLVDPDGCEGYPGTVNVSVIYTLTASNAIKIQYFATTDKPTPINLTNHSYFNLKDGGVTNTLGHLARFHADAYTPIDDSLIPSGEIALVRGTPIDFTAVKPVGRDIKAMGNAGGYDHNLVLRSQNGELAKAAEIYEPTTGRLMELWTTEPGVQFYSGNFLDGSIKGKANIAYGQHSGFCLETQHYPDSVNQPAFPTVILQPGQTYRQVTEYRFSTPASWA